MTRNHDPDDPDVATGTESVQQEMELTEYRRNPVVEAAPMSGETVLYNPETNRFCVLNETATFIWETLEEPQTPSQLRDRLLTRFEGVDGEVAESDIGEALSELTELAITIRT